jgi:hypothetical protein
VKPALALGHPKRPCNASLYRNHNRAYSHRSANQPLMWFGPNPTFQSHYRISTLHPITTRKAGTATELLKPAPIDYLQTWSVSKRMNGSRAPDDDSALIESIEKDPGQAAQ